MATSENEGCKSTGEGDHPASTLSPLAVPFIPRGQVVDSAVPSATETSSKCRSTLSADAPEFFPDNYIPRFANRYRPPPMDVLSEVRRVIWLVTSDPASLESLKPSLLVLIMENVRDDSMLSCIVEEVFNQAVNEANFRYSGARLCCFLSVNLPCISTGNSFQQCLVYRCLTEHGFLQQAVTVDNLPRLVGFTLFLGDLLVQMKDVSSGVSLMHFPQEIVQLIFLLLSCQAEDAYRCVVQVLKLTGSILEDQTDVQPLFMHIEGLIGDPRLPRNVAMAMTGVVQLRSTNWGRNAAIVHEYFSPDVVPIPDESGACPFDESDWCGDEFDRLSGLTSSDSVDTVNGFGAEYWGGDEVMDSETAIAYEQFLHGMHQQSSSVSSVTSQLASLTTSTDSSKDSVTNSITVNCCNGLSAHQA